MTVAAQFNPDSPSGNQLGWFLFFRVLLISLFLGGTVLYLFRGVGGFSDPTLPYLYFLIVLYYLQALVLSALIRTAAWFRVLVHVQIVWDLLFAAILIYVTGGSDSHFSFLFLLIILASGLLLSRRETLIVASASAIIYGSLLDLQYYGYLPIVSGVQLPQALDGREVFFSVFVNVVAFLLVGLLSGIFTARLKASQQALEKREKATPTLKSSTSE